MKKMAISLMLMGLFLGILTGCDMLAIGPGGPEAENPGENGGTETPLAEVTKKCEKLGEASVIGQTIVVKRGDFVQYESEKTYTKTGTSYAVTGSERKLNSLTSGAADAYTETQVEETVTAGTYELTLDLNELYFTSAPSYADGILEATVRDNSVEAVLGLSGELGLSARPHNMKLRIATDAAHVTGIEIGYTSSSSEVTIGLRFEY